MRVFTNVFLGTETVFTPYSTLDKSGKEKLFYEKGESLSMVATLVSKGEVCTKFKGYITKVDKPVVEYKSPLVSVIRGPDTRGSRVGNRIVHGLIENCLAVARGATTVNQIAHSRGAIVALLVAHEMQRLQTALSTPTEASIYDLLLASPCKYTQAAVKEMQAFDEEKKSYTYEAFKEKINAIKDDLSQHINDLRINIMAFDPVPGNEVTRISVGIGWSDERMHLIPGIVGVYEAIVCENEYTNGFIPVVPTDPENDTTYYNVVRVPGHHGTASGNLYDQTYNPNSKVDEEGLIQQLAVVKLIEFLRYYGTKLQPADESLALRDVINNVLKLKSEEIAELKFEYYKGIAKIKQVYELFKTTNYTMLGQDRGEGGARYIFDKDGRKVELNKRLKRLPETFVNQEHATLCLHFVMGFADVNVVQSLVELTRLFAKQLKSILDKDDAMAVQSSVQALLEDEVGQRVVFDNVSKLLNSICSNYLANNLTSVEKREMLNAVTSILTIVTENNVAGDDEQPYTEAKNKLRTMLLANLHRTLEAVFQQMIQATNQIVGALLVEKVARPSSPTAMTSSFVYHNQDDFDTAFTKIRKRYLDITDFYFGLNAFSQMPDALGEKDIKRMMVELTKCKKALIDAAAQLVKNYDVELDKHPLFTQPLPETATGAEHQFIEMVKRVAIAKGAADPTLKLLEQVQAKSGDVSSAHATEKLVNVTLRLQLATVKSAQKALNEAKAQLESQVDSLNAELDTVKAERDVLMESDELKEKQIHTFNDREKRSTDAFARMQTMMLALQTPRERACMDIINDKILPAITKYQVHLAVKNGREVGESKLDQLTALQSILTLYKTQMLPSESARQFFIKYDEYKINLADHGGMYWKLLQSAIKSARSSLLKAGVIIQNADDRESTLPVGQSSALLWQKAFDRQAKQAGAAGARHANANRAQR